MTSLEFSGEDTALQLIAFDIIDLISTPTVTHLQWAQVEAGCNFSHCC